MERQQASQLSPTPLWLGRLSLELRRLALPLLSAGHRGLLSITFDVPLGTLPLPIAAASHWFSWHRQASAHRLLGLGCALALEEKGSERFLRLQQCVNSLQERWTHINQGRASPRARAFLGFAFDHESRMSGSWHSFPNAVWVVPDLLLEWRSDQCSITFSHYREGERRPGEVVNRWLQQLYRLLEEETQPRPQFPPPRRSLRELPTPASWMMGVEKAVSAIRQGPGLQKVVLSRTLQLDFDAAPDAQALMHRLTADYPSCVLLGARFGDASLLAATPERLLALDGDRVYSDAIAGTVAGDASQAHRGMREQEHRPVVEAIRRALSPWCESIEADDRPGSLRLHQLSHLTTPVRARLRRSGDLFDLLHALHPTPAVGGVPGREALAWIRANEEHDRGWYTGAFGWVGKQDQGELAVVLRCGLLQQRRMTLFAGAGITAVSTPSAELEETTLKFRALLDRMTT